MEELIRGQYFHPMELPRKLFVVTDAHKIRQDYASKLLKTLEEPHPRSSIFFLNPHSHAMLPTIESRSILLRLPPPPIANTSPASSQDVEQSLAEVTPASQETLVASIIEKILAQCDDYAMLNKLQQELDWCETSATYHNNVQARFHGLMNLYRLCTSGDG